MLLAAVACSAISTCNCNIHLAYFLHTLQVLFRPGTKIMEALAQAAQAVAEATQWKQVPCFNASVATLFDFALVEVSLTMQHCR
jgi:type II secretory pathway component PulF